MRKCSYCGSPITIGADVVWDNEKRLLSYQGEYIQFSPNEAGLIDKLWRANQQMVTHDRLERYIWGLLDIDDTKNSLRVLACAVRKRIPEHFPVVLRNIPNWQGEGGGYWLER